jgi:hypothetical protein
MLSTITGGALGFRYENGPFVMTAGNVVSVGVWQHVAAVFNAGVVTLYVNGVSKGSFSGLGSGAPAANPTYMGFWYNAADGARYFQGGIDEWRVSGTARSAAWIATEYANQNAPGAFLTVGTQESSVASVSSPSH